MLPAHKLCENHSHQTGKPCRICFYKTNSRMFLWNIWIRNYFK